MNVNVPGTEPALRIGVTCYPTTGGSGIIATEIGLALARRGHHVHFICHAVPGRLQQLLAEDFSPGRLVFHKVEVGHYPLPHLDPYTLALAAKLAELTNELSLDLLHLHYAIPHATSAYLAKEILRAQGARLPRIVVTLHGTDITLVGNDPSIRATNRFSLLRSDGLTVPSAFLRQAAYDNLHLADTPIEVIPNFVDTDHFRPAHSPFFAESRRPPVLIHSSNFRPIKRVADVVHILAAVRKQVPATLILVGDGPERAATEALCKKLELDSAVRFLGMQLDVQKVLQDSDVFLLPSVTEGFGLAALEALSCGVPVVASRVGGVPEVVEDGKSGLLCEAGDVEQMAAAVLRILRDAPLHRRMSQAARRSALQNFQRAPMVSRYEAFYRRVLSGTSSP
jgi:N-acetyl-alpha-D-glucosaminyl L-malate synthase BshA